jgi:hypothetical protein
MTIELRDGPLSGQRRNHPGDPGPYEEKIGSVTHVWRRENDQAWARQTAQCLFTTT